MQVQTAWPAGRLKPWGMGACVFALIAICYWPALRGGLVWDDESYVTRPELRSWAGLGRIWSDPHAASQYYPVLHSAFWVEHRLWGDATLGYHLVNVLLHATSCCLLALVVQRLIGGGADPSSPLQVASSDRGLAEDSAEFGQGEKSAPANGRRRAIGVGWLAALLFAVHPVGVESVAWIAEQKNTLSLFFYLLAAFTYLRFAAQRSRWAYAWALVFFALALATKSVTVTLPAALLVALWWKRGRLEWRRDVVPLLLWFAAALAAGLVTVWVERRVVGAEGVAFALAPVQRLLLAGRMIGFYAGKLVWPIDLTFVYPRWDVPVAAAGWAGYLLGAIALTAGLWAIRGRTRAPLAAWLFFVGSLFPVLGFFNIYYFNFSYVADHFQYLADLGPAVLAAAGFSWALTRSARLVRAGAAGAGVVLLATLAVLAHRQSGDFRDGGTLYRATLAGNPDCWMAHNNLAAESAKMPGRSAEVLAHYAEALRLRPDSFEAHNNLGNELAKLPGRRPEALAHFERAIQLNPGFVEAQVNLANLLAGMPGRQSEALDHYHQALRVAPAAPETHFCLANTLAAMPGREAEAQTEYEAALRLRPDYAEAHENLAGLLAKQPGGVPAALAHYAEALRLRPESAQTHYNLGVALETIPGRTAEAFAQYEEALRIDPDYAEAHNNLAVLDARAGRLDEARAHWETALKLRPGYEDARKNLEILQRLPRR